MSTPMKPQGVLGSRELILRSARPGSKLLQPILRSVFDVGVGIGDLLAMLLTEEGERITTEESEPIKQESNNG